MPALVPMDKDDYQSTEAQLRELRSFTSRILDHLKPHLKTSPDKPLVIVMGEDHSYPLHYLAQVDLIRNLRDKGMNVAFGMEQSYDLTSRLFQHETGSLAPNPIQPHGGFFHLLAAAGYSKQGYAHNSNLARYKYLLREQVPTAFNDAPHAAPTQFDLNDPLVKAALGELYGASPVPENINRSGASGVAIRNKIMADLSEAHMKRVRPDVYIQQCGTLHVAGHIAQNTLESDHPYAESLVNLYHERGYSVVGIPTGRGPLFPCLPRNAEQSGLLLKNANLQGMATHSGLSDERWVKNAWSQLMRGSQSHTDLPLFQERCKEEAVKLFTQVKQSMQPMVSGQDFRLDRS